MSAEPLESIIGLASVEANVKFNGVPPKDLFMEHLTEAGSETWGPDSSGEYTSNCPSHSDRIASLRWTVSSSGVVKFHCLAGCDYGEVLKSLSLRGFDMRWSSIDFAYWDLNTLTGELSYLFDVRRLNKADAKGKTFFQFRKEALPEGSALGTGFTEVMGNGLEGKDNGPLWLWPMLLERSEDARAAGRKIDLIIVEGEKDALSIWRSGACGPWDFITTSAGGAGGWRERHTLDILALAQSGLIQKVAVICDPDKAGKARGPMIVSALQAAFEGIDKPPDVSALTTDGTDVADLADREGKNFWDSLTGMDALEMASSMEEGSVISGYVTRIGMDGVKGRKAMAMPKGEDGFTEVLSAELRPVTMWDTGWALDVIGPTGNPRRVILEKQDLFGKNAFDKWLINNDIAIPPRCSIGSTTITQGLNKWLGWYCETDPTVKKMKSTQYLTWVNDNGDPAKEPNRTGAHFVTGDPALDSKNGFIWTGTDVLGRWDFENSELDCAWAWSQALTFGDERTVAAVAGWAASILVAPWLSKWTTTKPGLAIVAISNSGKTHGASRMIMQLAGCRGNATGTITSIRRQFSAGGVSTIRWIDDAGDGMLENPGFKEILRITTSQSDYSLSDTESGSMATHSSQLTGCPVISAEGVSWMRETAMLDRFLLVQPQKPSGRTSLRPDREGQRQWDDVEDLQDLWGKDWASMAGWTVEGLRRAIGTSGQALDGIVQSVGRPGERGDIGAWYSAVGVRLLKSWLEAVKSEAGQNWPGESKEWHQVRMVNSWDWLVEWADVRLEEERTQTQNRYGSLVTQVLPLMFTRASGAEKASYRTDLWVTVPCGCTDVETLENRGLGIQTGYVETGEGIRNAVRMAVTGHPGGGELGMPLVLAEECGALWVDTRGLAAWYRTDPLGRNGEERVTGATALADQARAILDMPTWATWSKYPGKGRAAIEMKELKVSTGKGNSGTVRYVRINKDASEAAKNAD